MIKMNDFPKNIAGDPTRLIKKYRACDSARSLFSGLAPRDFNRERARAPAGYLLRSGMEFQERDIGQQ